MYILGIWDGHDSGAAIIKGDRILFAINEERLTGRKLEVQFPEKSIKEGLRYLKITPADIPCIALSTSDLSKTLARICPSIKEEYYQLRRRKKNMSGFNSLKKLSKYTITEIKSNHFLKKINHLIIKNRLKKLGFENINLHIIDHHLSHAAGAAFCSGFTHAAVITLDGIGDGLSGSIGVLKDNTFKTISTISGKDSLGIFFEHVTNLLNMRELEDEGKVMALANYASPVEDKDNPLLNFFYIDGLHVKARYNSLIMYKRLKEILWRYPSEQFAYMAQRTMEIKVTELIKNSINKTGMNKLAVSGGVASNIKINMLIKDLPEISSLFVFPHMGDGGLAMGAALCLNYELNNITSHSLDKLFLGPDYTNEQIEKVLNNFNLTYKKYNNIEEETAGLIAKGNIILWFQGRMEVGPRALGGRSILASPSYREIKNEMNIKLKKRVFYQPFCPSMLEGDAKDMLENYDGGPDKFMAIGYMVKKEKREQIIGVINIDGSCRPQIVTDSGTRYGKLLMEIKKITGLGVVMNTSFNIHGEPMVCSPYDAVKTFLKIDIKFLIIEDYLVTKQ